MELSGPSKGIAVQSLGTVVSAHGPIREAARDAIPQVKARV